MENKTQTLGGQLGTNGTVLLHTNSLDTVGGGGRSWCTVDGCAAQLSPINSPPVTVCTQ